MEFPEKVRARIWPEPSEFTSGVTIWRYIVIDRFGKVYAEDKCYSREVAFEQAAKDVECLNWAMFLGQDIQPWYDGFVDGEFIDPS